MDKGKKVLTIEQWNAATSGVGRPLPEGFFGARVPTDITDWREGKKASYGLSTTGVYNYSYSNELAIQVLYNETGYAIQPKYPYLNSAHTAVEALGTTAVGSALGGVIGTALTDTYSRELVTAPNLSRVVIDVNFENELLNGKDQVVPPDRLVAMGMTRFRNEITKALYADTDTLADVNLESVDRMINATGLAVTNHGYTAGDEDFMGVDRSANAWFDSNYNDNTNVDHTFQLDYLEDQIEDVENYADGPSGIKGIMIITGNDTKWRINQAAGPQIWNPREEFSATVGGVSTDVGTRYNIRCPTIHGIPIIGLPTHIQTDTISRIYLQNQDYAGIKILAAPAVTDSADPVVTGAFLHRYVAWTYHQLFSLKSKAHGTVWDLA